VRLSQVRLLCDDFGACFRYFRDVLGLTPGFGDEESGYADFAVGDGVVALFERTEQAQVVGLGLPGDSAVVVLTVDDLDGELARLRAAGGEPLGEPQARPEWGIRFAHLRDPDGHLLEVNEQIPMEGA
jgi:catechol 2,3-dioxygenase-like lactoylglutathione lyase family enzyme